ncbi:hypothetical protein [Sedimenticola selenatireducens]|uniref:hypothetical protein n=1 Tax=Sedimenticola selenatireducens TaxID=191960 RepID=UPI00048E8955|nr:hypothetical protein [Sedimenticola selenatireducens]
MKSETQTEQPAFLDEAIPEDVGLQPTTHRLAFKAALAVIVLGVITISVLWFFVIRQEEVPSDIALVAVPDTEVHDETNEKGALVALMVDEIGSIDRRLLYLSGQIEQVVEAQQTSSSNLKHQISDLSQDIQAIKATIADQRVTNLELGRQISEAISQMDMVIKDARASKVVKPKPAARHKPRSVKTPPFQIDAIDVWDDVTYVAISQSGRMAFLAAGEQQSGWRVTRIDRLKGEVDLQGPAGQAHSVLLQR